MGTVVRRHSKDDCFWQIAHILNQFPILATYEDPGCCGGCATSELRDLYGPYTADAYERLQDWAFLLGAFDD